MVRKGPFHFEGLLRVPMIWNWPGELPAGRRTDGLVSAVDFAPMLLDRCNVPSPYHDDPLPDSLHGTPALAGTSLVPQLRGERESVNDWVIVENDEVYWSAPRSYVTDRYERTIFPVEDYGELFDPDADPAELPNRWDDPEYADVQSRPYRDFIEAYVTGDAAVPRRLSHAG